jgi:hypothetical protein
MSKKQPLKRHSDEKQKQYEREIRLEYGPSLVNESVARWNSYSKAQQEIIFEEAGEVYTDMVAALEAGVAPQSGEVQAILQRWHENLRNFYEPTLEILRGLGEMYNTHPDFIANFKKIHHGLPEYLQASIAQYVDDLEYAEIERLLAQDEENRSSQ